MKVFAAKSEFDYSWEEVSTANWQKYSPWNKKSEHVIAVDTLSRTVDSKTGILRTERLITCRQSAPKWLNSLTGGSDTTMSYETSYVDPKAKKVTMCSTNLTWADLISVRETVVYRPSPINPHARTLMNQDAQVTALCGGWQKVKNSIEQAIVERFSQNAAKGREGFEMVLAMSRQVFAQERERRQLEARL